MFIHSKLQYDFKLPRVYSAFVFIELGASVETNVELHHLPLQGISLSLINTLDCKPKSLKNKFSCNQVF